MIETNLILEKYGFDSLVVSQEHQVPPQIQPRKSSNSLLKVSFENGVGSAVVGNNKYVTPYKHDPSVMNADLPLPPVTFRRFGDIFNP